MLLLLWLSYSGCPALAVQFGRPGVSSSGYTAFFLKFHEEVYRDSVDVGYRISMKSLIQYPTNAELGSALESDIEGFDIGLNPTSLIMDIGLSVHLCKSTPQTALSPRKIRRPLKGLSHQIFKSFIIYDIKSVLSVWTLMV
jgi:hypothetical protein